MKKGFLPVVLLFLVVTLTAFLLKDRLVAAGVSPYVLLGGNLILFLITLLSMSMNQAAMRHRNTQGFMRNVYGGFMLKFFLIIIAVLLYVALANPINKPALFACLGLYLFYTFFGTRTIISPQKPAADHGGKSSL